MIFSNASVTLARGPRPHLGARVRVGCWNGVVRVDVDEAHAWLSTPVAHSTGLALCQARPDNGEAVVLRIDGRELSMPSDVAVRIGGALLRKADQADDWQLALGRA